MFRGQPDGESRSFKMCSRTVRVSIPCGSCGPCRVQGASTELFEGKCSGHLEAVYTPGGTSCVLEKASLNILKVLVLRVGRGLVQFEQDPHENARLILECDSSDPDGFRITAPVPGSKPRWV